jgi:hypothetical protein
VHGDRAPTCDETGDAATGETGIDINNACEKTSVSYKRKFSNQIHPRVTFLLNGALTRRAHLMGLNRHLHGPHVPMYCPSTILIALMALYKDGQASSGSGSDRQLPGSRSLRGARRAGA